jgi:hypothetical protein
MTHIYILKKRKILYFKIVTQIPYIFRYLIGKATGVIAPGKQPQPLDSPAQSADNGVPTTI